MTVGTTTDVNKMASLIYLYFYWIDSFSDHPLIISFEWFFLCSWRSNSAENKSAGIHRSVPHKLFLAGKKNQFCIRGVSCFKRLNAYLCRCLEVNTCPQITKQPDYLCWTLSRNFSTYHPGKTFCILFLLSKNFCWMAFSRNFRRRLSDLSRDTNFKCAVF